MARLVHSPTDRFAYCTGYGKTRVQEPKDVLAHARSAHTNNAVRTPLCAFARQFIILLADAVQHEVIINACGAVFFSKQIHAAHAVGDRALGCRTIVLYPVAS